MPIKIKTLSSKLISWLQQKLIYLNKQLEEIPVDIKSEYDDLSPVDDAAKSEPYLHALNWALQNPKVKNLALTGPYGSGKTSILKTFEKQHPELNILNISLATFQDDIEILTNDQVPVPSLTKPNFDDKHRLIELSILQQMFYRVKSSQIPDSRFNRIRSLNKLKLAGYVSIVILTLIGIFILLFPKFWKEFSWWKQLDSVGRDWFRYGGFILIFPALYYISSYILRLFNFSKFNKINLAKGEVEFDPKSETSILNKHLDEILYYFQVIPIEVVFIEDLDRFNDPEIFTKLRELNNLINQSKQVGRRIVFVYVIKDDMFKDKSRTKFFDFIVPVVPVINSSNSFDVLLKMLEGVEDLKLKLSDTFLSKITLYIDDMRVLKNIFNEFLLYRKSLSAIKLVDEELFAMIVYKNLNPKDFAALHEQKGMLFNVFKNLKKVKDEITLSLRDSITTLESRINDIRENSHLTLKELRQVYLFEISSKASASLGLTINGSMTPFSDIADSESDLNWLTGQTNIMYYHYDRNYGNNRSAATNRSFKEVEDIVNPNSTYKERANILQELAEKSINTIRAEIERIEKQKSDINKLKIFELLELKPDPITKFGTEVSGSPLLVYLLRNGYINEQYNTLISYFYPGHLTVNDMDFALSVANREGKDFDFELIKIDKLISRLDLDDFKQPYILNFKLGDYLAQHKSEHKIAYANLVTQLAVPSAFKFLDAYFDNGTQQVELFTSILKKWKEFWNYVEHTSEISYDRKVEYLKFIAANMNTNEIKSLNIQNGLRDFVVGMDDYLNVFKDSQADGKKLVDALNPDFTGLQYEDGADALFDHIYGRWNFAINAEMIKLMLSKKANPPIADLYIFEKANYSTIKASGATDLIAYLEENLDTYVEDMLLKLPENTDESETSLIELLNKSEDILSSEIKERVILKQNSSFTKLQTINDKALWSFLIAQKKVLPTWQNVLDYFEFATEVDEYLFDYLSTPVFYNVLRLAKFNSLRNHTKELYNKFSRATLLTDRFESVVYDALLDSNPFYYDVMFDLQTLSVEKAEKLIRRRTVRLSPAQFSNIKEHFKDLTGIYLVQDTAKFLKERASYELNDHDYVNVFKTSVSNIFKLTLVEEISDETFENNFLLASYAGRIILEQEGYALDIKRLTMIIKKSAFKDDTLKLFLRYASQLDIYQIDGLLPYLKEPYCLLAIRGKQVLLAKNTFNTSLVETLRAKGYVKNPSFKDHEIRIYNKKTLK
jgi:hypothetical protein